MTSTPLTQDQLAKAFEAAPDDFKALVKKLERERDALAWHICRLEYAENQATLALVAVQSHLMGWLTDEDPEKLRDWFKARSEGDQVFLVEALHLFDTSPGTNMRHLTDRETAELLARFPDAAILLASIAPGKVGGLVCGDAEIAYCIICCEPAEAEAEMGAKACFSAFAITEGKFPIIRYHVAVHLMRKLREKTTTS